MTLKEAISMGEKCWVGREWWSTGAEAQDKLASKFPVSVTGRKTGFKFLKKKTITIFMVTLIKQLEVDQPKTCDTIGQVNPIFFLFDLPS